MKRPYARRALALLCALLAGLCGPLSALSEENTAMTYAEGDLEAAQAALFRLGFYEGEYATEAEACTGRQDSATLSAFRRYLAQIWRVTDRVFLTRQEYRMLLSIPVPSAPPVVEPPTTPPTTPPVEPTPTPTPKAERKSIWLGHYEQDNDPSNGAEPVEWLILLVEPKDNSALVISRYVLDMERYHSSWSDISWKKCAVRYWLNGKFWRTCFTAAEREAIKETRIYAYYVDHYVKTDDTVFFLSADEVRLLLPNAAERQAEPTDYALAREVTLFGDTCYWWLRDSSTRTNDANYVDADGAVVEYGGNTNAKGYGVRPAMWVWLNQIP